MGKTGKWMKHFLTGKKEKEKNSNISTNYYVDETLPVNGQPTPPITVPPTPSPKEKKRWSFRRSSTTTPPPPGQHSLQSETEHIKHALRLNASPDAAVVAAKASASVMEFTSSASDRETAVIEESAAIKIQSFYRGHLSRKALNALRGLVKLQALVRGHLVRKQAAATLRCMQALITVQSRAKAQRLHMVEESKCYNNQKQFNHRKSAHEFRRNTYQDIDIEMEENVKIVEMDPGDSNPSIRIRSSYSSHVNGQMYPFDQLISKHKTTSKHDQHQQIIELSQSQSQSPRAKSGNVEEYTSNTAQSSPEYHPKNPMNYERTEHAHAESNYQEYPQLLNPSYMANTKSSRAKVRSQSAPKARPELYERQSSGRRRGVLMEGRNVIMTRGGVKHKMQRSSSQVAAVAKNYEYPWAAVKLDKSTVSFKDSECGSSSTVLTNDIYCRSLVGFQVNGNRY